MKEKTTHYHSKCLKINLKVNSIMLLFFLILYLIYRGIVGKDNNLGWIFLLVPSAIFFLTSLLANQLLIINQKRYKWISPLIIIVAQLLWALYFLIGGALDLSTDPYMILVVSVGVILTLIYPAVAFLLFLFIKKRITNRIEK